MEGTAVPDRVNLDVALLQNLSEAGVVSLGLFCEAPSHFDDLCVHSSIDEDVKDNLWGMTPWGACDVADKIYLFETWEFEVVVNVWSRAADTHGQMLNLVSQPFEIVVLSEFDEVCLRS